MLHSAKDGFELSIAQTRSRAPTRSYGSVAINTTAAHINDANHANARIGLEAVGGEAVVDGV
jgi:hypothetical protein